MQSNNWGNIENLVQELEVRGILASLDNLVSTLIRRRSIISDRVRRTNLDALSMKTP